MILWALLIGGIVLVGVKELSASVCGCVDTPICAPDAESFCAPNITDFCFQSSYCEGAGMAEQGTDFYQKVSDICGRLGIDDPNWLVACMTFESGLSSSIVNQVSKATGLIQFLPRTATALGTSIDTLAGMSAIDQLDYVEAYFQPYAGRIQNLGDCYMAILWPAAIGADDGSVLWNRGSKAYTQNSGLDLNKDGTITRREAYARVQTIYNSLPVIA